MSLSVGTTQNNVAYEKALEGQGILTGVVASGVCGVIGSVPARLILKDMYKMNDKLSSSQINEVRGALQKGLKESELLQKGVKFIETAIEKPKNWFQGWIGSSSPVTATVYGKNACYLNKDIDFVVNGAMRNLQGNTIFAPQNKMVYSWFHEMGHALNFNNKCIGRTMQKLRVPGQIGAILIPMIALLSKKRNENGEKPLSAYDKTINFIRNNAGKLTFLCFAPALIEEGMATAKGQKWAEKLLSSNLAKNVLKHNKLAFLTYAVTALATGYCAYAGVRAKDKYIETKKKQQQNKIAA